MKNKHIWHKVNKPFVYWYYEGVCQECNQEIRLNEKYDVHHLHYNYPNLYFEFWINLIEAGVIILVHRSCHNKIHQGTEDEALEKNNLINSVQCDWCGNYERGILDRKKGLNIGKNLCRKCFKSWRGGGNKQLSLFER